MRNDIFYYDSTGMIVKCFFAELEHDDGGLQTPTR